MAGEYRQPRVRVGVARRTFARGIRFLTDRSLHTTFRSEWLSTCRVASHLIAMRHRDRAVPVVVERDHGIQRNPHRGPVSVSWPVGKRAPSAYGGSSGRK